MFVDVANIEAIHEEVDGESARNVLAQWTSILRLAATQRSGFLVRKIGCSLLFSFAEADNALACAIAIEEMAAPQEEEDVIAPAFRVGIHAGDVGGKGAAEAVKAVARITAHAKPCEILMTEKSFTMLSSRSTGRLRRAESIAVGGSAIQLYRVDWEHAHGPPKAGGEDADDPFAAHKKTQGAQLGTVWYNDATAPRFIAVPPPETLVLAPVERILAPVSSRHRKKGAKEKTTKPMRKAQLRLTLFWEGETVYVGADTPRMRLGRELDNDIVVTVQTASRYHAVVEFDKGTFKLTDTSRNGTFVYDEEGGFVHVTGNTVTLAPVGAICPGSPREARDCNVIFFRTSAITPSG
jgi:hypothetical protein